MFHGEGFGEEYKCKFCFATVKASGCKGNKAMSKRAIKKPCKQGSMF